MTSIIQSDGDTIRQSISRALGFARDFVITRNADAPVTLVTITGRTLGVETRPDMIAAHRAERRRIARPHIGVHYFVDSGGLICEARHTDQPTMAMSVRTIDDGAKLVMSMGHWPREAAENATDEFLATRDAAQKQAAALERKGFRLANVVTSERREWLLSRMHVGPRTRAVIDAHLRGVPLLSAARHVLRADGATPTEKSVYVLRRTAQRALASARKENA